MKFILGKKLGMSQVFDKKGKVVPVTVIEAGPCFVVQIKEQEKDGYKAIQVGFEKIKDKKIKKTQNKKPYRHLKEFLISNNQFSKKVGDKIDVSIFSEGDIIKVSGISKGKGFQGVVKRHGFSGGPATHGHRHVLRAAGSIGSAFPQKIFKGKKMPGRAGGDRITVSNLKVISVDSQKNILAVAGATPGPNSGLLEIISV